MLDDLESTLYETSISKYIHHNSKKKMFRQNREGINNIWRKNQYFETENT